MINSIKQYFSSLKPVQIAKEIAKLKVTPSKNLDYVQKTKINNQPIIIKKSSLEYGVGSIASSRMYKKLGINTPELYLLKNQSNNITTTFQADVSSIDGFITTLAADSVQYSKLDERPFGKCKWHCFYDPDLINTLLQFMTPSCLEQLQNIFLIDEIRTDNDRHQHNFFFYRTPDSNKYQGIIVVDLDNMVVYNYCKGKREDFQNFLFLPYGSFTPQKTTDYISYFHRVNNLRQVIQEDLLSSNNIKTLRNSLNFDFPAEIKRVCLERGINAKEYNKITSIMGLPKGMPSPDAVSAPLIYDIDNHNNEVFEKIPEWIRNKIMKSTQWQRNTEPKKIDFKENYDTDETVKESKPPF